MLAWFRLCYMYSCTYSLSSILCTCVPWAKSKQDNFCVKFALQNCFCSVCPLYIRPWIFQFWAKLAHFNSLRFFRVWLMFINMYALLPLMLRHGRAALAAMVIPCPQLHMNSIKRAHKDNCSLFKVLCNSPLHGAKLPGNAAGTLANCFPYRPM